MSGLGFGLSVVALTLPWITLRDQAFGSPIDLPVTGLEWQGPVYAVLLVITAIVAGVGFAVGRYATKALKYLAVTTGPIPAVATLLLGLRPPTERLRDALTPVQLENWNLFYPSDTKDIPVSPMSGLNLYSIGLLLIGLGLAIAALNSYSRIELIQHPDSEMPRVLPALARWGALVLSVPMVALSLSLAWFEIDVRNGDMPAVVVGWFTIYRIGLISTLLLLTAMAISTGGIRRVLRAAGLFMCCGLAAVLALNALLLWDPSGLIKSFSVELEYLRVGPAFLAAIAATILLLIVFSLSTPPIAPATGTPTGVRLDKVAPNNVDGQRTKSV